MSGRMNLATLQEMAEEVCVEPLVLERDWVLTEIVYHLARQPVGSELVLKGGQAFAWPKKFTGCDETHPYLLPSKPSVPGW